MSPDPLLVGGVWGRDYGSLASAVLTLLFFIYSFTFVYSCEHKKRMEGGLGMRLAIPRIMRVHGVSYRACGNGLVSLV